MGKIDQNKERKRRAILDAAQSVFLSEGYALSSMDRIAVQAQVTKQTVYRYFPTKIDLFQATLRHMGENSEESFLGHLENPNDKEALYGFAVGFIHAHLSNEHLDTFRLLVAECAKAPEITGAFFSVAPDETDEILSKFFKERLGIAEPEIPIRLWTSMLLAFRDSVLMGMARPNGQDIDDHAKASIDFLLAGTSPSVQR